MSQTTSDTVNMNTDAATKGNPIRQNKKYYYIPQMTL